MEAYRMSEKLFVRLIDLQLYPYSLCLVHILLVIRGIDGNSGWWAIKGPST